MAHFTVAQGRLVLPNEVQEGWYVSRQDENGKWIAVGKLFAQRADAEAEVVRLNQVQEDQNNAQRS